MGYRSFTDDSGVEWQAWDIIPRLAERRAADRRSAAALSVSAERRGTSERRQRTGGRLALSNGLHAGWLCFETQAEKRRLSPIPADWLRCALATLREYLASAVPAARMSAAIEVPMLSALDRRHG
jgi:hypothetical protein